MYMLLWGHPNDTSHWSSGLIRVSGTEQNRMWHDSKYIVRPAAFWVESYQNGTLQIFINFNPRTMVWVELIGVVSKLIWIESNRSQVFQNDQIWIDLSIVFTTTKLVLAWPSAIWPDWNEMRLSWKDCLEFNKSESSEMQTSRIEWIEPSRAVRSSEVKVAWVTWSDMNWVQWVAVELIANGSNWHDESVDLSRRVEVYRFETNWSDFIIVGPDFIIISQASK